MQEFKIQTKTTNGPAKDVTRDFISEIKKQIGLKNDLCSKDEVKNIIRDEIVMMESAYIRTKTIDEIKDLIEVTTYIDDETPIVISSMFFKNDSDELYDNNFVSYNTYQDSKNDSPKTSLGKLYKLFSKNDFIISAIYKNNNIEEEIDPKHWTSVPRGVNSEWPYEWKIQRVKRAKKFNNGVIDYLWEPFTYPVLYNNYYVGNDINNIECNDEGIYLTIKGVKYDLIVNDDYTLSVKRY